MTEKPGTKIPLTKAVLVCVSAGRAPDSADTEELSELARSDLLEIIHRVSVRKDRPEITYYLGSGKIEEIASVVRETGARVVVFNIALSAAQERNISKVTQCAVLDRTELILEIFQKRAKSREGRLQVELAKLEHLSTRLVRGWTHLERQRGGLGKTGGPGEKQIELDRRLIANRISRLKSELKNLSKQRLTQRTSRFSSGIVTVSIVGYTNAGKSTLFNKMTRSDIYAADQLFATLDTTARRAWIGGSDYIVLSDTVGFIRDLPHQLVEAFKSTLDEAVHADILLKMVDASSPVKDEQMASVDKVLLEIGALDIPSVTVYNKIDQTGLSPEILYDETHRVKGVRISALTGDGLNLLRDAVREKIQEIKTPEPLPEKELWEEDF